jgi:hypothetical protein
MIYQTSSIMEWQQDKRKKYYNKRFSHEFWIRMGRELQYDL